MAKKLKEIAQNKLAEYKVKLQNKIVAGDNKIKVDASDPARVSLNVVNILFTSALGTVTLGAPGTEDSKKIRAIIEKQNMDGSLSGNTATDLQSNPNITTVIAALPLTEQTWMNDNSKNTDRVALKNAMGTMTTFWSQLDALKVPGGGETATATEARVKRIYELYANNLQLLQEAQDTFKKLVTALPALQDWKDAVDAALVEVKRMASQKSVKEACLQDISDVEDEIRRLGTLSVDTDISYTEARQRTNPYLLEFQGNIVASIQNEIAERVSVPTEEKNLFSITKVSKDELKFVTKAIDGANPAREINMQYSDKTKTTKLVVNCDGGTHKALSNQADAIGAIVAIIPGKIRSTQKMICTLALDLTGIDVTRKKMDNAETLKILQKVIDSGIEPSNITFPEVKYHYFGRKTTAQSLINMGLLEPAPLAPTSVIILAPN